MKRRINLKERIILQVKYMGYFPIFFGIKLFTVPYILGVGNREIAYKYLYEFVCARNGEPNTEKRKIMYDISARYYCWLASYDELFREMYDL